MPLMFIISCKLKADTFAISNVDFYIWSYAWPIIIECDILVDLRAVSCNVYLENGILQ